MLGHLSIKRTIFEISRPCFLLATRKHTFGVYLLFTFYYELIHFFKVCLYLLFILYIPCCNSTTYIKTKIIKQMQRFRLCRSAAEKLSETSRPILSLFWAWWYLCSLTMLFLFCGKKSFNWTEIKLADQTTKTIKIQNKKKKCNKIYLVFENHSLPVSSAWLCVPSISRKEEQIFWNPRQWLCTRVRGITK